MRQAVGAHRVGSLQSASIDVMVMLVCVFSGLPPSSAYVGLYCRCTYLQEKSCIKRVISWISHIVTCSYNDCTVGLQPTLPTFDVEELLSTNVGTKARLHSNKAFRYRHSWAMRRPKNTQGINAMRRPVPKRLGSH